MIKLHKLIQNVNHAKSKCRSTYITNRYNIKTKLAKTKTEHQNKQNLLIKLKINTNVKNINTQDQHGPRRCAMIHTVVVIFIIKVGAVTQIRATAEYFHCER